MNINRYSDKSNIKASYGIINITFHYIQSISINKNMKITLVFYFRNITLERSFKKLASLHSFLNLEKYTLDGPRMTHPVEGRNNYFTSN